ncbi:MAG TPA: hypothetical protein VFM81_08665 [Actinomycetota bacterium]|nr:hypothetical protein [Actinomycetota bacterium]
MTDTRTFIVVGRHPNSTAAGLFADVRSGGEAFLFTLGLQPTPAQQLVTEEALSLAANRRFVLTAETVSDPATLRDRLREAGMVLIAATRGERRRWHLRKGAVSAPGAR